MRIKAFTGALAAAGLLLASSAAFAASGLDVRLGAVAGKRAGDGVIHYSLTNQSSVDVLVLSWETPLRGIEDDLFEVSRNGQAVRYVGREYKRGLPQPEDYIEIKAGQTLSAEIDLSAHYEMRDAATYAVQFVGHFHDRFAVKPAQQGGDEKLLPISDADLRSPIVSLWVDGASVPVSNEPVGVWNIEKAGSTSFVGCSNSQVTGASSGHTAAQGMTNDANTYLAAGLRGARYTTWFGTYSSGNYATIKSNFLKIDDAVDNKAIKYNCGCTSNAYAYVYPTRPYEIFLCSAFWSANTSGTDSKGGTIVHEMSHFDIVANTDDLAYGQTACKKLAGNAKRAIKNADSHEYFAENSPKLN